MTKKKGKTFKSAEIVQTTEGNLYHIGIGPKDIAPYILLFGDPARVDRAAALLDDKKPKKGYRDFLTVTGKYKGIPVSVMSTGVGTDNTEIAVVELSQIVKNPTFIRVGSTGALKKNIKLGDLIISSGALRLENTSTFFVFKGFPAVAHHEVVTALLEASSRQKTTYHLGITASCSGFYGAQGRVTPHFKPLDTELPDKLETMNVLNFEMESSTLFSLSSMAGYRAGTICAVYAQRYENKFIDTETMKKAEMNAIKIGLNAVEILHKMDKKRGKNAHWLPSMGI